MERSLKQVSSTGIPARKCKICKKDIPEYSDAAICNDPKCFYSAVARSKNQENEILSAQHAGIPKMYENAKVTDFPKIDLSPTQKHLENNGSIFLPGDTGIGKTHLAAALSIASLHTIPTITGYDFMWTRCPDLLMQIRSTYNSDSDKTEQQVVDSVRKVGLLVLDDLGAEKITDWSMSAFYAILASRVDECRPTIVTSNLGLKQLHAWEPRIASRLASFNTVALPKVDRRIG